MSEQATQDQQQEEAPKAAVVGKAAKAKGSGDLIADIATEVEGLTKAKALTLAVNLAENIETNYFKLGGVLKVIFGNAWFEGFETFDAFVHEKFGFKGRKARYLMDIYTALVTHQIPWEKVGHLGWTKLKDLAPILTADNVDEWVAKAETCTVSELQALLAQKTEGGEASAKTTSDTKPMKFVLKNDQIETVNQALNKCKAEVGTDHDNVALEMICAGYLGGNAAAKAEPVSLESQMKALGWEEALKAFGALFDFVDIDVTGLNEEKMAAFNAANA